MSTEERGRRAVPVTAVLAALSALLLVAVVILAVLAAGWHKDAGKLKKVRAEDAAGEAALKTAQADLVDITTYSYKTIDKDFGWLHDFADTKTSEPFAKNQKALAKVVKQSKTVAKGTVSDAMSRVVSTSQVEVLAFVDQVLKAQADKGISSEQQRVSMTMKLVDGTWKIARLDLLGGNGDT